MVDLLVRDTDVDVNAKTQVGMTALHLVCMSGDLEICSTLLRYDADIRAKTADDSTPLHTAIFNCNTHLAELLIKQGQWGDFIKKPLSMSIFFVRRSYFNERQLFIVLSHVIVFPIALYVVENVIIIISPNYGQTIQNSKSN